MFLQNYRIPLLRMLLVLGFFIGCIGLIEGYFFVSAPEKDRQTELATTALEKAKKGFYEEIAQLELKTKQVANQFSNKTYLIYTQQINPINEIDFIVLDSLKRIINWSNKAPLIPFEKIIPRNNIYRISIKERDYFAFTDDRVSYSVTGILLAKNSGTSQPGLNKTAYSIVSKWISDVDYPVQLRFLAKDVWNVVQKKELIVGDGKVIGYLAAYPNSFSLLEYHWNGFKERTRSVYLFSFVILSLVLFLYTSRYWPLFERFFLRTLLIVLLWILTSQSDIERYLIELVINWGFELDRILTTTLLKLSFHTFFYSLTSYELIRVCRIQRRYFGIDWYPRTLLFSLVAGIVTYLALSSIPLAYFHLVSKNEINLLDPNLFPPIETFLFITGLTLSFGFGLLLSLYGNHFIAQSEQDTLSLFYPMHIVGFFGIHLLFLITETGYATEFTSWKSLLALYALMHTGVYFLRTKPHFFQHYSKLRLLLLGSFLLTLMLYPSLLYRYQQVIEQELNEKTWSLITDLPEMEAQQTFKGNNRNNRAGIYTHDKGVWPGNTYIALYDSQNRLRYSWNRTLIPFSESGRLPLSVDEIENVKQYVMIQKNIFHESKLFLDHYFFVKESGFIIRGIIPVIPFQTHVFAFFRFFYTLLFFFLLLYGIQALYSNKPLLLLDTRENLQSRILDSYIIASLVFLVALVGTTGYIVLADDVENHLTLLHEKKELILTTITNELNGKLDEPFLRYLAQRFEVSIDLYDPRKWVTGASYQNAPVTDSGYLLERGIYESLIMKEQMEEIRWYDYGKEQIGAVFLPFQSRNQPQIMQISLRSTVSGNNESLLKTVSYLIAVYVFVFGIFIVLAYFISTYLADPLKRLLQGLRRISSGRLDTIVPVTTQDEIGELANAYNFMIFRLKDLQKELAEAERQAAWSEMARQIAHEIKNPLTPMKLSLQHLQRLVLMQDEQEGENLKPAFERISKTLIQQIDSLSSIAANFSKFAQPQSEPFTELNLNDLLLEINDLYQHDRFIKINLDLSDNPLLINGIEDDLKRVFINLMKNSIEAMENGGIIIVRTYPYKDQAFVEFADTGSGIPVEIQSRVFQPNFSTKSSGTGIGLAICKKIVDAHGGSISFASVPKSGTTFTLSFPLVR